MNPIEYVWIELKKLIHKIYLEFEFMGDTPETVKPKIADAAVHAWELLNNSIFQNLVDSMHDHFVELRDTHS